MVLLVVQKIAVALLLLVLVFNLTQRRHLAHGEYKRYATLYAAGLLLLFYAATIGIGRYDLSPSLLILVAALEGAVLYLLRTRILIFRFRCATCAARLPLERVLYFDSNQCDRCAPLSEAERESGRLAVIDSPIASAGAAVSRLRTGPVPEKAAPAVARTTVEIDWEAWAPTEKAVLCFVAEGERLLLIEKKTGLGSGKVNAPGGRVEPGESPEAAAIRETEEEIGVTPRDLRLLAELSFQFVDGYSLSCHVFVASGYAGEIRETAEAAPFWCARSEIPYDRMWADDRLWLPGVLSGTYTVGRFILDGDALLDSDVTTR